MPNINKITATTKQNRVEFRFIPITVLTSAWDAPEKVNTHEKAVDAAIMNSSIAELLAESLIMGIKSLKDSSLYIKIPAMAAHTTQPQRSLWQ